MKSYARARAATADTMRRRSLCAPSPPASQRARISSLLLAIVITLGGCERESAPSVPAASVEAPPAQCDANNAGLQLPLGFCAVLVADHFANLRELAIAGNGDIYGSLLNRRLGFGGLVALRDRNGDGTAEEIRQFGEVGGVGLAIHDGHLYLGADRAVLRYRLDGGLVPAAPPEVVVDGLPAAELHASKTLAFDESGGMFVTIGAPSNACQRQDRRLESPGVDPCEELEDAAGIWRFDAMQTGQTFADGERYASGIRHALAVAWEPRGDALYVVQHGRDELSELWPQKYTAEEGELVPAEEMLEVTAGATFSWPYCYYDPQQHRRVLAPEYGGDGTRADRCNDFPDPVAIFPAHYGPNDMLIYGGRQFPKRYHGGAFIAFHGAFRTQGGERRGYQVVFVPMEEDGFAADWEVFADGFGGTVADAPEHRPTGLAEGPDGSLYIADSVTGRIWRVIHRPNATDTSLAPDNAAAPARSPESRDE